MKKLEEGNRIAADLQNRCIKVGTEKINLSNYDIKHLREVSKTSKFGPETCQKAVERVIEEQIKPFLIASGKEINYENIEKEVLEAFSQHLYILANG